MIRKRQKSRRQGAIIPLLSVSLLALFGFVALAIDVGMIAVARTQCQNAADAAAMSGARALNGTRSGGYNTSQATADAVATATGNTIQSKPIPSSQVQVQVGSYTYDYGK